MSVTFTLTGAGNCLSASYFPPIELNPTCQYSIGLVAFYSCNALRNICEGNNKIYYGSENVLTIPDGAYEITALNEYINKQLSLGSNSFSLTPNINTLKCLLYSTYTIDFRPSDSIGRMLGYSPRILNANENHESDLDVRISPATSIRVECNITSGAYCNGAAVHTLFEFALDVEPGERIIKEPQNILYLPITTRCVDNIALKLTNQDGESIDFGQELVTIRLELKKYGN
ncbi:TPA_asm: penton [Bos-associated insect adintovirus]|uniref:Penton n=1 Tax=Bos-associated insect adintovirus TaxID=2597806 RepID=A0A5H3CQE7_9VIRU|nr:TPA_asm: penton [Bos-associated insect adintovirus]